MTFGLTENGFELKRLEDIKLELENDLREAFGEITVEPDSVFGQLIGVMARHLAEVWEQAEAVYLSFYPASAEGVALDGVSQLTGVVRLAATKSEVVCQLSGLQGTVVSELTKVSQSERNVIFEQADNVMITRERQHRTIVTVLENDNGTYTVTIDGIDIDYSAIGRTHEEIAESLTSLINAEPVIQDKVLAEYSSGETFFTITVKNEIGSTGVVPLTVNRTYSILLTAPVVDGLEYTELFTPALYRALLEGKISVPIGSVNTIETPVAGFDSVTNFEDGIPGRNPETDVELRLRRLQSLQIAGAATIGAIEARVGQEVPGVTQVIVIENRTDDWVPLGSSPTGRPPHSIEAVVEGGDDLAIAEKIWQVKAAGIQTHGNTQETIIDSNGDPQIIEFSRPVGRYVYIRVDFDRTGAEDSFPADGIPTMRERLYNIGAAHDIGVNVIRQKFFTAVYSLPGITDATVYLAIDAAPDNPAPTWVVTNLTIAAQEIALFESNVIRIVINDITT